MYCFRGSYWCNSCCTYRLRGAYWLTVVHTVSEEHTGVTAVVCTVSEEPTDVSGGTPCFRGAACHVSQGWPGGGAESHRSSTPGQQGQATQDVPSVDPVQVSQTPVTWKSLVGDGCQHMHDSHIALACLFVCVVNVSASRDKYVQVD